MSCRASAKAQRPFADEALDAGLAPRPEAAGAEGAVVVEVAGAGSERSRLTLSVHSTLSTAPAAASEK